MSTCLQKFFLEILRQLVIYVSRKRLNKIRLQNRWGYNKGFTLIYNYYPNCHCTNREVIHLTKPFLYFTSFGDILTTNLLPWKWQTLNLKKRRNANQKETQTERSVGHLHLKKEFSQKFLEKMWKCLSHSNVQL